MINECIVARRGIRGVAIFIHQQDVVDTANCPPAPHHNITVGRRLRGRVAAACSHDTSVPPSRQRDRERESPELIMKARVYAFFLFFGASRFISH